MKPVNPADELEAKELLEKPFDASDPEQVNTSRKKSARRKNERLKVIQALMTQQEIRGWLFDILTMCNVFGVPLVPNDTHATYFRLGEQNVGKKIMSDIIAADEEGYLLMIRESRTRH